MHVQFIFTRVIGTLCLLATLTYADPNNGNKDNWRKANIPPSPSLSVQEALDTFRLAPGFAIEAVASEPALDKFYDFMHTPVGQEQDLIDKGYEMRE